MHLARSKVLDPFPSDPSPPELKPEDVWHVDHEKLVLKAIFSKELLTRNRPSVGIFFPFFQVITTFSHPLIVLLSFLIRLHILGLTCRSLRLSCFLRLSFILFISAWIATLRRLVVVNLLLDVC
jgi:hypothetical protein